jgi:hypothetical protein
VHRDVDDSMSRVRLCLAMYPPKHFSCTVATTSRIARMDLSSELNL